MRLFVININRTDNVWFRVRRHEVPVARIQNLRSKDPESLNGMSKWTVGRTLFARSRWKGWKELGCAAEKGWYNNLYIKIRRNRRSVLDRTVRNYQLWLADERRGFEHYCSAISRPEGIIQTGQLLGALSSPGRENDNKSNNATRTR